MASSPFQAPLVYVDSCVYLDLITRNPELHKDTGEQRWTSARTLFRAVEESQVRLASSALIEAEVCCNGKSREGGPRVRSLLQSWFSSPSTVWTDIDRFLARDATQIIGAASGFSEPGKKLRSADALHLAAASRLNCDYLMTHDGGFPIGQRVNRVAVRRPGVVWQESMF